LSRLRGAVVFALSVVAALFFVLTAAGGLQEQTFGLTTVPASGACALLVTRVSNPGQPGGLHAGDMIDTRDLSTHERLRLMVPRQSDHMMLPTHRMHERGGTAMVMVVPHTQVPSDAAYLRLVVLLVLMLLGLYVMWRGKDAASLGLGIFFTMMPAFLGLSHAYPGLPDQAIIAVLFLATMLNLLGYFGLYFMVDALAGASMSPSARTIARTVVVVALVVACTILFSAIYGRVFTGCPPPVGVPIVLACYATVIGVCFVMLWRGIVASNRGERGRLRWLFWSTVVGYSGPLLTFALISSGSPIPLQGAFNLSFLAIPIGYTYAVLRHRVIDVGFVLTRTLSLTILTTAVVAAFILVGAAIEHLAINRDESVVIQLGFSLGLGMLFNAANSRLNGLLERVLFRRRYAIEMSLKGFDAQVDTYLSEGALMRQVADLLTVELELAGCAVYREAEESFLLAVSAGSASFSPEVSKANEPPRRGPASDDQLLLPLRVHGRSYGAIVLQQRDGAELLTPDEVALLERLAVWLAGSIAAIRAEQYERLLKTSKGGA
jgi:hypothetical protein